jgi:hypothetical protein
MASSAAPIPAARSTTTGASTVIQTELDYRPSYLAAGIASLAVFILYLITLAPSTAMWDASEYISAAYVLGLPHPPGNPFFVLIGNVFAHLPIPGVSVAVKLNMLAALSSAVAAGAWFLITERVLVSWLPQRWMRLTGASVATLIGATAFTVWNQSVVNEKVYTVSLAIFAIVAWLTVVWCDEPEGRKGDKILILIAFLLGLGYANHPAGMLPAPAVGLAILFRAPKTILKWKLILACFAAVMLGLSPFATQPIRAAHFPAINEGEPTACATEIGLSCTFNSVTWDRFKYNFDRGQYGKPALTERQAPIVAQVQMWWLYFKWQWLRDAHNENPGTQNALAVVFFGLGLIGGWVHYKRDQRSFLFFGPLIGTLTIGLIIYLNFKYGYSQDPELGDSVIREVRDRDYFYLWSFSAWSVWAALGLIYLWETVAGFMGTETIQMGKQRFSSPNQRAWRVSAPVLGLALIPMIGNWSQASRAGQRDTRDFAYDLLNSVEPYGILITVGDNDTFPLWYAQEVEGIRKDVLVANTSLMNTDWYTRQMIRRPIYEYDAANGPAIYKDIKTPKPTTKPLNLTLAQADSVPLYVPLDSTMVFTQGTIQAIIDPKNLAQGVLERADILTLYMIRDNWNTRPIYFSRTSGGYGLTLGLGQYLLTQGLARKLLHVPPGVSADTIAIQGEGFVDVKRSLALWNGVFMGQKSIIARGDWVDKPSAGIPALYVSAGIVLGDALRASGKAAEAKAVVETAKNIAQASRTLNWFGGEAAILGKEQPTTQGGLPPGLDTSAQTAIPLGQAATPSSAPVATPKKK